MIWRFIYPVFQFFDLVYFVCMESLEMWKIDFWCLTTHYKHSAYFIKVLIIYLVHIKFCIWSLQKLHFTSYHSYHFFSRDRCLFQYGSCVCTPPIQIFLCGSTCSLSALLFLIFNSTSPSLSQTIHLSPIFVFLITQHSGCGYFRHHI